MAFRDLEKASGERELEDKARVQFLKCWLKIFVIHSVEISQLNMLVWNSQEKFGIDS